MAELEAGLYALCVADAAVAAAIGTRMYPLIIPQGEALPAIAYQRISARRIGAQDGPTGLARARIQLRIVGSSYATAKSTATAVRELLDGYKGVAGGVTIESCWLDNDDDAEDGTVTTNRLVFQDYLIMYQESV